MNVAAVVYQPVLFDSKSLHFARVGFVSESSASILIREPDKGRLPPFTLSYRRLDQDPTIWIKASTVDDLSQDTDFTSHLLIQNLRSSTPYEYKLSNGLGGTFKTAPRPGQVDAKHGKFTFLTSSCIKPRFPYNPFSHPRAIPGLNHLTKWIPRLQASFMLFLGDFIYIDVPYRHGTDVETYRHEYRQVYSSPDWQSAANFLPWIHVIDDHEIANDWDQGFAPPYPSAIDPWDIYHASINPPPVHPNGSYFQFTQGPATFFLMDTRRYRDTSAGSSPNAANKTMLGPTQLDALLSFLSRREPDGVKWKFVVSSIPFTRNWRINSLDTWAGYLRERQTILEAMWDVELRGEGVSVVVLSGDRHEFAATAFPPQEGSKWPSSATVHEFSTSPLSMFYLPFRSYWEKEDDEPREKCLKYRPDGNSKFGAVELENIKGSDQGLLRFRLFIDGDEVWQHILTTPPTHRGQAMNVLW